MIVDAILEHLRVALQAVLIDNVTEGDDTRAGYVKIGPYQGDPTPEEGRITVSIHENDPDGIVDMGVTALERDWSDDMEMVEIGGAATMARQFTIKARCLLSSTREGEADARRIAFTVRGRIESTLKKLSFSSVRTEDEYVARGALGNELKVEMLQAGGPPDAFDYNIKVHFSVLTTQIGLI